MSVTYVCSRIYDTVNVLDVICISVKFGQSVSFADLQPSIILFCADLTTNFLLNAGASVMEKRVQFPATHRQIFSIDRV